MSTEPAFNFLEKSDDELSPQELDIRRSYLSENDRVVLIHKQEAPPVPKQFLGRHIPDAKMKQFAEDHENFHIPQSMKVWQCPFCDKTNNSKPPESNHEPERYPLRSGKFGATVGIKINGKCRYFGSFGVQERRFIRTYVYRLLGRKPWPGSELYSLGNKNRENELKAIADQKLKLFLEDGNTKVPAEITSK